MTSPPPGTPTCYCGRRMALRRSQERGARWICPDPLCEGEVGCHPRSTRPLGNAADRWTRRMRIRAHRVFDRLWKWSPEEKRRYRAAAYRMLAAHMGRQEIHIGELFRADLETVIEICKHMEPDDLEDYLEASPAKGGTEE